MKSHHTGQVIFQKSFRMICSTEVKDPNEHHLYTQGTEVIDKDDTTDQIFVLLMLPGYCLQSDHCERPELVMLRYHQERPWGQLKNWNVDK